MVFADPDNDDARALQADALEQLGYQAESGPWRDFYLTGAQELRAGTLRGMVPVAARAPMSPGHDVRDAARLLRRSTQRAARRRAHDPFEPRRHRSGRALAPRPRERRAAHDRARHIDGADATISLPYGAACEW